MRFWFSLVLILILLSLNSHLQDINGILIKETEDHTNDIYSVPVPLTNHERLTYRSVGNMCAQNNTLSFPELSSITYIDSDKFLNATVWLSEPFYLKPYATNATVYSISIFPADSQIHNAIYTNAISWDPTHKWKQTIYTHSITNSTRPIEQRTINNFFGNGTNFNGTAIQGFVDLSVSKETLPFPTQYFAVTSVTAYDNNCLGIDIGQIIDTFPPLRNKIFPISPLEIRAGQEKVFELAINSTLNLNPKVSLEPDLEFVNKNAKGIRAEILNQNVTLDSSGTGFTRLKIDIPDDTAAQTVTFPMNINLTFPRTIFYPIVFNNIETQLVVPLVAHDVAYLHLNVDAKLTAEQQFENFWKIYGGAIALISAGFFAGLGSRISSGFFAGLGRRISSYLRSHKVS